MQKGTDGPASLAGSRIERLVGSGYLSIALTRFETNTGAEKSFEIIQATTSDTKIPPFMQTMSLHVKIVDMPVDLDAQLAAQKSWAEIWYMINQ